MKLTKGRSRPMTVLMHSTVLFGTLSCINPAWAQTPPAGADTPAVNTETPAKVNPADANEIVVTAQFRAQRLQDTPISITALTGASLEQRSATSLADAANSVPSVLLRPQTQGFGSAISASIRGLGQGDFNPALEPGVGIYIDDVYMPRLTGANLDLMDVQRVEVLRGPQGTLTGKNSEGGAIKFFSKLPSGGGGGYVSAGYGSRNRINLRASADFTLTDGLFARVSGTYANQGGYVDVLDYGCTHPSSGVPATGGGSKCLKYKEGDVNYQAIRGIVRFSPNARFDAVVSADYMRESRHSSAQVLLYADNPNPNVATSNGVPLDSRFLCGPRCNYDTNGQTAGAFTGYFYTPAGGPALIPYSVYASLAGIPGNPLGTFTAPFGPLNATAGSELTELTAWGVSGNVGYELSDTVKVTSVTSYREFENVFSADGDLSPANVGFGNNDVTDEFFSQELRLSAKLSSAINVTVGGYYSDEKAVYYTLQDIRYAPIPLQFIGNDPIRTKSRAAYGNVELTPLPDLTINGGLRYTHDSKSYTFVRLALDGVTPNPFLGALNGVGANFSGDRVDYRVAANYRISPEVMAYTSVATGYKAGGVGPRPFNPAQARGFGPEKVTNYEVGLKTDLFDRKVRLNLDVFYLNFKDAQLTLLSCPQYGGPGPCALPQNAGDAHSKGVEAEITARPLQGLQFEGAFSYQDWKWTCINPQVVGLAAGACSSDASVIGLIEARPPGMMKWKWSAGVQYEADLGASGTLTPRIDVNYQGDMIGNVLRPTAGSPAALFGQLEAFTLANARLTWRNRKEDLDIALEVTNIFDKYYFVSKFDLTGVGAGSISGAPGRPREWAVTVKKVF